MNVNELFNRIRIDGKIVENVVQITADAETTTVVYDHQIGENDHSRSRRVITVESEAVTFG